MHTKQQETSKELERVTEAARETLLAPAGPYHLKRGDGTLFVTVNGCVFAYFRWMVDAPPEVSRRAFAESVADLLCASLERRAPAPRGED